MAKYYISTQKWIPCYKEIKNNCYRLEKTIFVEEALHRLVEIHFHLRLRGRGKKICQSF